LISLINDLVVLHYLSRTPADQFLEYHPDKMADTTATTTTNSASTIAKSIPSTAPKQGFRFSKTGAVSPIPPPSSSPIKRVPSQPSLISESTHPTPLTPSSLKRSNSQPVADSQNTSVSNSGKNIGGKGFSFARSNSLSISSASDTIVIPVPSGVDAKLFQIVKKLTASTPSLLISTKSGGSKSTQQSRKNKIQAVTSLVLERHREYRRKDLEWVRSGVEGALSALGSSPLNSNNNKVGGDVASGSKRRRASSLIPVGGGSNVQDLEGNEKGSCTSTSTTPGKKKKAKEATNSPNSLPSGDSSQYDSDTLMEVDEGAVMLEATGSFEDKQYTSGTMTKKTVQAGGMLNATLRDRYKDVQREREKEVADAMISTASPAIDESSVIIAEGESGDRNLTNSASGAATNATNTTTPTTTPKKKKKASKKISSRSSSNGTALGKQSFENHADDPSSAPSTLLLPSARPTERYSNLGGISSLLQQLRELIEYPLSHPELFLHLGVEPPRGVLLRGPPGCGKTHLAKAIAGELNVSYFQVSAPELVGGVSGESELRVRTLFESAARYAPAIIFIDEIDAIAPKRGEGSGGGGGGKSMEKRIVAQLLTSMDSIHPNNTRNQAAVMVLGATNRPDAMDPALRRAGRFDREIILGAPDESAREAILRVMTKDMRVEGNIDFKVLARKTPGFVGADVRSLTKEAAVLAINRIFRSELLSGGCLDENGGEKQGVMGDGIIGESDENAVVSGESIISGESIDKRLAANGAHTDDSNANSTNDVQSITPLSPHQLEPLYVTMEDFLAAIPHVQPSSKREGFATVPDVSWGDIGALANIREELTLSVLEPISHPERFEQLGLPLPAGVLLYGPPGCGKTLLAKAIANESGANFISVKGPELLDKYVGESERAVRVVFERARSSSPCIIFFDELDSLCPKRGSDGGSGGGGVSERVVNQLLTEMDGLDSRRSVFVIAATNRPELIDPAMLRPGRLDKLLYVPLPSPDDRLSILRALSAKVKLAADVDLYAIAHNPHANGFSGADCAALLREAGLAVLRDGVLNRKKDSDQADQFSQLQISAHHFKYAFDHVLPSVSKKDQARYDRLRGRMARARTRSEDQSRGDSSDVEGLPEGNNQDNK